MLGASPAQGVNPGLARRLLLPSLLRSVILAAATVPGSSSQQYHRLLRLPSAISLCVPQSALCFFLPLPSDKGVKTTFSEQCQEKWASLFPAPSLGWTGKILQSSPAHGPASKRSKGGSIPVVLRLGQAWRETRRFGLSFTTWRLKTNFTPL